MEYIYIYIFFFFGYFKYLGQSIAAVCGPYDRMWFWQWCCLRLQSAGICLRLYCYVDARFEGSLCCHLQVSLRREILSYSENRDDILGYAEGKTSNPRGLKSSTFLSDIKLIRNKSSDYDTVSMIFSPLPCPCIACSENTLVPNSRQVMW